MGSVLFLSLLCSRLSLQVCVLLVFSVAVFHFAVSGWRRVLCGKQGKKEKNNGDKKINGKNQTLTGSIGAHQTVELVLDLCSKWFFLYVLKG